ncbi:DNA primase [Tepidimicrobium xylanilyticum]
MSYNIDEELIERIHDTVDLIDVVSKYIQLKKTGSNYVGLCPFHNEKTPSFTISESKQLFHCFGCGEGGDVISFIMKIENLSFVEAVRFIAEQEGIPIMEKNPIDHKLKLQKDLLYEINREAAKFYYLNLGQNREALEYLGRRNLNKDIIKRFGLGYAPDKWDSLKNYLIKKGYEEEDIEKAGLIGKRKDNTGYYDKFRNRIMFPIIDGKGRVIGFGGRVLDQTMPKYLNSKDSLIFIKGNNLYGLNLIKRNFNLNKIILVEGYMDVISLYRNGIDYAVASLGTAFTSNQAKLLKRLNKEIYICYDSDNAGINATIKALNILDKEGLNPKVILLPKGHDPDDFINKMGLKEFEKLIDNAFNPIDYKILILRKKYNVNDIDGKIKFVKEVSVILRNINSPVEREIYIDKIAKEMEISEDAIKKEVLGNNYKNESSFSKDKYIIGRNRYNKSKIAPIKAVLEPAHLTAEKMLIRLMLESRSYYNIIKGYLNEEDFLNYESNILAKIIFDEYEKKVDLMKIANDFILVKLKQEKDLDYDLIYEIMDLNVGVLPENKNTLIKDLIKRIKISKLEMERKKILNEIKEIESKNVKDEGDVERFKLLCLELTKLDKELQSHT